MIEWLVKFIRLPNWSAAGVLREKVGLLELKIRELEAKALVSQTREKELDAQLEVLRQENQQLKAEMQRLTHTELDETQILILSVLDRLQSAILDELIEWTNLDTTRIEYALEQQRAAGYIHVHSSPIDFTQYSLSQKGREYVLKSR